MGYRRRRGNAITFTYKMARYGKTWQLILCAALLLALGSFIGTAVVMALMNTTLISGPEDVAKFLFIAIGLLLTPFLFGLLVRARENGRASGLLAGFKKGKHMESIGWHDFERLCAGVLREMGYRVVHKGGSGGDGGIDLIAEGRDGRYLVQAKHWKSRKVGVAVVREMVGAAVHHGFNKVMVITSGEFTKEAKDFSKGKNIVLVDGQKMRLLVSAV